MLNVLCNIYSYFSFHFFFWSDLFRIVATIPVNPVDTTTPSQYEDYLLDDANDFGNKQGKRSAPKRKMPGDENISLLGQGRVIGAKRVSKYLF